MIEQMNLFELAGKIPEQAHASKDDTYELIPCPICNVLPEIWVSKSTGGHVAKCPDCGYMVHTLYDINEHWYSCNEDRMWRYTHGGRIYESDCLFTRKENT